MPPTPPHWSIAPYFIVDNVLTTAHYYRDTLGFSFDRFFGEPPTFCMVHRNGIIIMLSQLPQTGLMRPNSAADPHHEAWDAYIWVGGGDNADALHDEFKSKGATITRPPCNQPYGNRDFDLQDPNGYILCFGHNIQ